VQTPIGKNHPLPLALFFRRLDLSTNSRGRDDAFPLADLRQCSNSLNHILYMYAQFAKISVNTTTPKFAWTFTGLPCSPVQTVTQRHVVCQLADNKIFNYRLKMQLRIDCVIGIVVDNGLLNSQ